MADAEVKVSGSLYLPWIRVDSKSDTPESEFKAMIRVKAPSAPSNPSPIHLVVVLDVCGTTATGQQRATGQRLDLLKMMEFIQREFRGNGTPYHKVDVVTVLHDSTVKVWPHIDEWISMQGKAENLKRDGATDLKQVLVETLKILKPSSVDRLGFIILVSDGESKSFECGEAFAKQLREYSPVHALGLGNNHAPKVLHDIAKKSGGTYSSVADADTDNSIMEAMALCLGGLKSVVAMDTRVKISVPGNTDTSLIKGLKIVDIQWGGRKWKKEEDEVFISVLYAGEVKDLIVRIQFGSDCTFDGHGRARSSALTAAVKYYCMDTHTSSKQQRRQADKAKCEVPLLVISSGDARTSDRANSSVLQQMILYEVAEKLLSFATKEGEAKTQTKRTPAAAADRLRRMWKDLKEQGKNLLAAQKMSDLIDLRGIDNDIDAMAKCLEREGVSLSSRLSRIYSWVSSYQMQRATTTGLPLPSYAFQTPRMDDMVRNARKHLADEQEKAAEAEAATKLLEKLEQLFDENRRNDANESMTLSSWRLVNKVHKVIKKAANSTRTTTTSGSGDKKTAAAATTLLDDDLKNDIKAAMGIRLMDRFIELEKSNSSQDDIVSKTYTDAEAAVDYLGPRSGKTTSGSGAAAPVVSSSSRPPQETPRS